MKNEYYNFDELKKCKTLFNFTISPRSSGKTIAMKKQTVDDFLKTGKRFVYVRRRGIEITTSRLKGFYEKMQKYYHKNLDLDFDKGRFVLVHERGDTGAVKSCDIIGYAVALSTAINERSVDFVNIGAIYFEEFCLTPDARHDYLEDEVFKFLELYNTIAREDEVPVYFLGNKLQEYNPYFLYFDIKPPKIGIKKWKDFAIEIWQNENFVNNKLNTRFGRLVDGTDYADYAIRNQGFENNESFQRHLPKRATPFICVLYSGQWYTVYICIDGTLNLTEHYNDNVEKICLSSKDIRPDITYIKTFLRKIKGHTLTNALKNNRFYYESPKSEEVYRTIAKRIYF